VKEYYLELKYRYVYFWEYFDSTDSLQYGALYSDWKDSLGHSGYKIDDYLKVLLF
jgi:hypothetical protein